MDKKSGAAKTNTLGVEYDLSTIRDMKGGYIIDQPSTDATAPASSQQRVMKRIYQHEIELKQCEKCSSENVSMDYKLNFDVDVCMDCISKESTYSLLTKTECKQDYLLQDHELEALRYFEKPNPHRKFSRMKLFLRKQVEEFAFGAGKYGSEQALDDEHDKRQLRRQEIQQKRYQKKIVDMRRRTMTSTLGMLKNLDASSKVHKHTFEDGSDECTECGLKVETEEF